MAVIKRGSRFELVRVDGSVVCVAEWVESQITTIDGEPMQRLKVISGCESKYLNQSGYSDSSTPYSYRFTELGDELVALRLIES